MGYFTDLRLNENVEIQTPTGLVKVIVKNMGGSLRYREADFEIVGIPNLTALHLKYDAGEYNLMDNLSMEILSLKKGKTKRVRVNFNTPYHINKNQF